jgi:RNA polymerase subunit RPABC4/transcription elongation factor Spt4
MKKVCKTCNMFVTGDACPVARRDNECAVVNNARYTESWKGRIYVFDPEKSLIAKKAGYNTKGEYAIKVR